MKTSHTILSLIIMAVFGPLLWVVLTTPTASGIKNCLTTKTYKVLLCSKNRNYVQLKNVSPQLVGLILIAEDFSFYSHKGFDWSEIENSFKSNFSKGRLARGGSTITQQLAKNVFLDFDKSFFRKIREALLARQIEKILSKKEILERYLNVIELGPQIYGVKAAANYYFKKEPADLNLLEAAFITYLIPNPKMYSKVFKKGVLSNFAKYRILDLSYRMFRFGRVPKDNYLQAKALINHFPWTSINFDLPDSTQTQADMVAAPDTPEVDPGLIKEYSAGIESSLEDDEDGPTLSPDEDMNSQDNRPLPEGSALQGEEQSEYLIQKSSAPEPEEDDQPFDN